MDLSGSHRFWTRVAPVACILLCAGAVRAANDAQPLALKVSASKTAIAEGLALRARKEGLKEGTRYTVKTFAPSLCQAVEAQVEVGAKKQVDLLGRIVRLTEVKSLLKTPP